ETAAPVHVCLLGESHGVGMPGSVVFRSAKARGHSAIRDTTFFCRECDDYVFFRGAKDDTTECRPDSQGRHADTQAHSRLSSCTDTNWGIRGHPLLSPLCEGEAIP